MKLEDLERDILGAYLNYENNDLKTAVKQLDMSANSLLKDDKTLDPVWTNISKNVYISVILNNFSKGNEFSLKDLQSMLNNQALVYNNIIEFCNKFENTEEITFATSLKKISENPLKSAIQILKENIEKINNLSVATLDNNIASAENKTEKITQCDILEIVDKKANATTTYDIKTNVRNVVTKMDISYLQDGKEIQEERIVFAFDIIDVNEKFITIKTNPMCEVINDKINLNNVKTDFKLYKNQELTLSTPTMDRGYTYKLSIKKETLSPDELKEIMNHVYGNGSSNAKDNEFNLEKNIENVFETWNEIKNRNLNLKDFFEETEKESINELIYAKDKATIKGKKLSEYLKDNSATCSDKNIQLIISYFGFQSLYDMKFTNDGNILCEEISVDNVGLFRAVLMINIIVKLDSIVSVGLPLNIKFTFERKEFAEMLSPMLNYYLPKIFNNIKEIKILYKLKK